MVYVAILETRYQCIGTGETPDAAWHAACKAYRASVERMANGRITFEGRSIWTDVALGGYFGRKVYGPMRLGEGVCE